MAHMFDGFRRYFAGETDSCFADVKARLGVSGFAAWLQALKWLAQYEFERDRPRQIRSTVPVRYAEERAILARMANVELFMERPGPSRPQSTLLGSMGSKVDWREEQDDEYEAAVSRATRDGHLIPTPYPIWKERAENCTVPARWHFDEYEETLAFKRAFYRHPNLLWLVWQICAEGRDVVDMARELGCHRNTVHNYVTEGLARWHAARLNRDS